MDPETAERILDNHGLAVTLVAVGVLATMWGVRAVWSFVKPKIDHYYDRMERFISTIEDNSTRATHAIDVMQSSIQSGHAQTHGKLDEVHADVRVIRSKVEGRT